MKVNINQKLDSAEQVLKDLHSILAWAKDNNVGLGEIAELLPEYNNFKRVVDGKFDDDFGWYVKFVNDSIEEMEEK